MHISAPMTIRTQHKDPLTSPGRGGSSDQTARETDGQRLSGSAQPRVTGETGMMERSHPYPVQVTPLPPTHPPPLTSETP